MKNLSQKPRNNFIDWTLLALTITLVLFGLIIIYDASVVAAYRDFGDKLYYFKNQLAWAAIGFFSLTFFYFYDYHKLVKISPVILLASIFLLVLVLIPGIGTKVYGARRWINLASFTFQPSEFAKISFILYQTYILSKFEKFKIRLYDSTVVIFIPALVVIGLVIIQPDLGTALIFAAVTAVLYFIGKAPIWHFLIVLPIITIVSIVGILSQPYRIARLKSFLDPFHDPQGSSYQISQILIAISSGGLWGVGLGGSRSKFAFIPEVQSDAIFAVLVEELGFLGAIFLIGLFLILINKGITIAKEAPDYQGKLLATGITGLVAIQSFFNLASMVALVPLTGIPLPFISYGGSSLLISMTSLGILLNIKKQSLKNPISHQNQP